MATFQGFSAHEATVPVVGIGSCRFWGRTQQLLGNGQRPAFFRYVLKQRLISPCDYRDPRSELAAAPTSIGN